MDKEDARKQTLEQLHERRKQVVRLHNKGHKIMQIVEMTGLTYPTVRSAIDLFVQGGWPAIRPTPRGRAKGEGRLLTHEQENRIQRGIIDQRPVENGILFMESCGGDAPQKYGTRSSSNSAEWRSGVGGRLATGVS